MILMLPINVKIVIFWKIFSLANFAYSHKQVSLFMVQLKIDASTRYISNFIPPTLEMIFNVV